ncbi:MAG: transketolase C-terminal domain-containing protein [Clostridium sp.]|uniref:transketolase family protein n=1 Tax=Clostridium culturomicium TaxID=1499683 RepID=UPI0029083B00|nr:transketolase C-terminal domain-containing protein [Clostridium sp.]MDU7082865.1 transketolase C-terminal domain-containing protein [Clostridium sp.]
MEAVLERKSVAIRDAFGEALLKLGEKQDNIVALEADVGGSTKSAVFGKAFPERYFNVGISEINMVSMAAGFASNGYVPFVNTFATFLTTRGADPIQSLIAYDKLNVKLAGTYCGLSDSYDGASHHGITDMAFVRAIPNMTVVSVSDAVQTEKAVFALAEYDGPVYLRLSRAAAPVIYDETLNFEIGKGIVLKYGKDVTIIATGTVLHKAIAAAEVLEAEGISATVVDMHTVKPIDTNLILNCANMTGAIVTVEEHSIYGGLGSAVAEVLAAECPTPMEFVGATEFAESGDYNELLDKYGYSAKNIAEKCKKVIGRK